MITANEVFRINVNEKKELIIGETENLDFMDSEIDKAMEISRVINTFLPEYFDLILNQDKSKNKGSILQPDNLNAAFSREIGQFKPLAIAELRSALPTEQALLRSSKNVYEMSGAVKLAFANKATRNLSTTMGLLWERLASISPYVINPEIEFNIKVKGIDLMRMEETQARLAPNKLINR